MGVGYRWLQGKPKELLGCWSCCGYTLLPRGAVAQPAFVVVIDVVAIAAAASINKTREHCKQGEEAWLRPDPAMKDSKPTTGSAAGRGT